MESVSEFKKQSSPVLGAGAVQDCYINHRGQAITESDEEYEDHDYESAIEDDIKYSPHKKSWPAIERRINMTTDEVLEEFIADNASRRAGSKKITESITSAQLKADSANRISGNSDSSRSRKNRNN